ncbi:hypothetical protein ACOMHN_030959 [Nucella lapillus]
MAETCKIKMTTMTTMLERGVSPEQHRWAVEQANKHADEDDFVEYILPQCYDQELKGVMTQLMSRGLWWSLGEVLERGEVMTHLMSRDMCGSVGKVLERGVSATQHRWAVEQACKRADEEQFANYILRWCREEELELVSTHMASRGLWKPVDSVTQRDVPVDSVTQNDVSVDSVTQFDIPVDSVTQNNISVDSVTQNGIPVDSVTQSDVPVDSVTQNDIPVDGVTHSDVPVDSLTQSDIPVDSVTQSDVPADGVTHSDVPVDSVTQNDIPADGVTHSDVPVDSVTQNDIPVDSVTQSDVPVNSVTQIDVPVDSVTQNDVPVDSVTQSDVPVDSITKSDVSITHHILSQLVSRGLFEAVGKFLQRDISSEQHRCAVEQAIQHADDGDFVEYILPQCHDEEMEEVMTYLVSLRLWGSVGKVLERGVSPEQHRWAVEQASKHANGQQLVFCILPRCCDEELETLMTHLVSRGLWT